MHDSEPSETQTNTFWFTLSTEELFKNHFLFGMSTTLKENILYVGLILVVTFLAVFPMLFECFFASRRRRYDTNALFWHFHLDVVARFRS